jgi:perosamine synthetase
MGGDALPPIVVPVSQPWVGDRELELVSDCVRSGWISSEGNYIKKFESGWAEYCGVEHGVAVSNGTAALQLAVQALELQPGDEVILPTFTIISCAQAIVYAGARPVLVDAEPRTWCMEVAAVAGRITGKTRAIMPVHTYGHPVDMDPLQELAHRHGLAIIEDAAEAHGATYRGRRCGGLGDLGCFSFYANKIVTTGEGGMVVTRSAAHAERLRSLRNLCFQPGRRFYHETLGHNFRMTNLQAAVGVAQLERIEEAVARKREMAAHYLRRLAGHPLLRLPVEEPWAENVYWMFGLVLEAEARLSAAELARLLRMRGVETRPFFLGMHRQPALHRLGLFAGESYPVADTLAERGLYLPSGLGTTPRQRDEVCDALLATLQESAG